MIDANFGLVSVVRQKNPAIQGTHYMIHKASLVSKTIPKRLHKHSSVVINDFDMFKVQSSTLESSASFVKIWMPIILLFYITLKLYELSKGNMLSGVFELRDKVKLLLIAKNMYLVYLADILEALNRLNKKL